MTTDSRPITPGGYLVSVDGASDPVPVTSDVVFVLPNGAKVSIRLVDEYLYVSANGRGKTGAIMVQPQASNVVRVATGEWW